MFAAASYDDPPTTFFLGGEGFFGGGVLKLALDWITEKYFPRLHSCASIPSPPTLKQTVVFSVTGIENLQSHSSACLHTATDTYWFWC